MSSVDSARIVVREASAADYAALIAIGGFGASHKLEECLVAQLGEAIVGFVVLNYSFFGFGFIPLIVVAPPHRRRGIAMRLLSEAELRCSSYKLFTSTNASNEAAQALFVRAGFVRSGAIENLDKDDPEVVFFKRTGLR